MPDHLADDEGEILLREFRIEVGIPRQRAQAGDLLFLPPGIGRRHVVLRLQRADPLGAAEAFREHVDHRRVDVVDGLAHREQFLPRRVLAVSHARYLSRVGRAC